MGNDKEKGDDLIQVLWDFLRLQHYDDALVEIRKPAHKEYLHQNSLTMIPALMAICNEEFFNENAEKCLEKLLTDIALKSNSKEATIAFLEQMEKVNSIPLFNILLKPLGILLLINAESKTKSCSWIMEIIFDRIKTFDVPYDIINDKEVSCVDDLKICKHKKMLEKIITFFQNIYQSTNTDSIIELINGTNLLCYSLLIFETPLVYLNLDQSGSLYNISVQLINMVKKLTGNILFCIKYIKPFTDDTNTSDSNEEEHLKISQLAISSYLYCTLCLPTVDTNLLPLVYNPFYLFYSCLPSCIYLLTEQKQIPQFKGTQLCKHFLDLLPNNSLTIDSIEVPNFLKLCRSLINITLYSGNEYLMKFILRTFKIFCTKLDKSARLHLIQHILLFYRHACINCVVIHEFKELLMDEYKNSRCSFSNKELRNTLELCCSLSNGEKNTDLFAFKDKIISALNLLIFLSIRDKENVSGWKICLPTIQEKFLKPLDNELQILNGCYKRKLALVKDRKLDKEHYFSAQISTNDTNISDDIVNQEASDIQSVLNCFALISSLTVRLHSLL